MRASSVRTASCGTPPPAHPKVASCRRCWPTSPCRSSTSTSRGPGRATAAAPTNGPSGAGPGSRTIGSSATRTTSWCWWPGPKRTPRPCGRTWRRYSPDRATPVGGENEGLPPRRGLRLPRGPHPAETEAWNHQARGLHLPVEEGTRLDRRAGPRVDPQVSTSDTCRPAAPAQPGAAGLVHLLSIRRVEGDVRLPRPVHLAPGGRLDPQTTPPCAVGRPAPTLPTRLASHRGRGRVVPAPDDDGQPLPLPGRQHRHTLGKKNTIRIRCIARRHGLVESRMRGDTHVRFGGRAEETQRS